MKIWSYLLCCQVLDCCNIQQPADIPILLLKNHLHIFMKMCWCFCTLTRFVVSWCSYNYHNINRCLQIGWIGYNYCFSTFYLRAVQFVGDRTGVLHVGPGLHATVHHADDLEFIVNVVVYENGTLLLPASFMCVGITITVRWVECSFLLIWCWNENIVLCLIWRLLKQMDIYCTFSVTTSAVISWLVVKHLNVCTLSLLCY